MRSNGDVLQTDMMVGGPIRHFHQALQVRTSHTARPSFQRCERPQRTTYSLLGDRHQAQCSHASPIGTVLFNPTPIEIIVDDCVRYFSRWFKLRAKCSLQTRSNLSLAGRFNQASNNASLYALMLSSQIRPRVFVKAHSISQVPRITNWAPCPSGHSPLTSVAWSMAMGTIV